MSSGKKSDSNFLVQGSILAIASIVSRIIGLLYRIPMTNIIGDTGNSYYSAAFEIYNILLIISATACHWRYPSWYLPVSRRGKEKMHIEL